MSCGLSTAAGTPLFAERRAIATSSDEVLNRAYLCGGCSEELYRRTKTGHLSDDQLRGMIDRGELQGTNYKGLGSFSGFLAGGPR